MKQTKIDWSGVQFYLIGICCIACLTIGMIIGAVITQKNMDYVIKTAQEKIRSEIQKIEDEKQIELDRLTSAVEKYLKRKGQ